MLRGSEASGGTGKAADAQGAGIVDISAFAEQILVEDAEEPKAVLDECVERAREIWPLSEVEGESALLEDACQIQAEMAEAMNAIHDRLTSEEALAEAAAAAAARNAGMPSMAHGELELVRS